MTEKMSLCKRTAAVVVVAFRSNVHDNQSDCQQGEEGDNNLAADEDRW